MAGDAGAYGSRRLQGPFCRATSSTLTEVVVEMCGLLGARVDAYLGSVSETGPIHHWPEGSRWLSAAVHEECRG